VTYLLDSIEQVSVPIALNSSNSSTTTQVYESSLGFRWRTPWKRLEVYAGFRMAHYDDVAVELRPKNVTYTYTDEGQFLMNINDVERVHRSVTYEGLYGGLRIRLY